MNLYSLVKVVHSLDLTLAVVPWLHVFRITSAVSRLIGLGNVAVCASDCYVQQQVELWVISIEC